LGKKSIIKDLIKIFATITLTLIFSIIINFIEIYMTKDVFSLILLMEIFKFVVIFIFARTFISTIIIGSISWTTMGVIDGLLSNLKYGAPLPATVMINLLTGVLLGMVAVYPVKRSKNILFSFFIIGGIAIAVIIHFYYFVYQSFFMGIFAPFYMG